MQQKMKKLLAGFLALVMVLTVVNIPAKSVQAAEGDVTITLLETTDVHGHLVDVNGNGKDASQNQYKLAYMAKLFNDYRAQGDTILLDSGDIYQGTVISNIAKGKYVMKAYDAMKYDVVSIGNHEYDWGISETVDKGTIPGTQIPVVCSNIYDKKTNQRVDYAQKYTILERSGKKIAVIGWVDEYSADIKKEKFDELYYVKEDPSLLNEMAKELKADKKADAVIVLAHQDAEEAVELFDKNYVDFVFGGHSHKEEVGIGKSGIPYAEGYKEGRGFAKVTMTITKDNKVSFSVPEFVNITKDEAALKYTEATKANFDEAVYKISEEAINDKAVQEKIGKELAQIEEPLTKDLIKGSLTSTMGNFVTDLLRAESDYDIAFCNDGGIRCNFEKPKMITSGDILTLSPFENKLNKVVMTGAQVINVLEQIVGNDSSNMQMSGITAKYDLNEPEDQQVFDVKIGGEPIDLEKEYTILVNDYIATGGNKYVAFDNEHKDYISNEPTGLVDSEVLMKNLEILKIKGTLKIDKEARFVEATKPAAPTTKETKVTYVGKSFNVEINGLKEDANIKYVSSNEKVATVSMQGVVKAVAEGNATITAIVTQEGCTFKLQTKVTVKKPSITFTKKTKTLKVGKTFTYKVKLLGVSGKVKWTSTNSKVASISKSGKVTAKKAGKTTIKATIKGMTVSCKLVVKKK